jgi:folylpolyglutamate synthase
LCAVRERIRINGKPIPERLFAKYFFQLWDRLTVAAAAAANTTNSPSDQLKPPYPSPVPLADFGPTHPPIPPYPIYFRLLTLLSFHIFLSLRVRATILEVGIGGTYDSTNIVPRPLVTGVSSLGVDHVFVLGNTVEEIAKNKGGIFKPGVDALAVEMDGGKGEKELRECAEAVGVRVCGRISPGSRAHDEDVGLDTGVVIQDHTEEPGA